MMQQAYKKGKIVESWNRKIVFVVQDLAMEYLRATCDCSMVTDYNPLYPVDFCSFSMKWKDKKRWSLEFSQINSTTIEGINLLLGGAKVNEYPTEEEFILNIIRKGVSDGLLKKQ